MLYVKYKISKKKESDFLAAYHRGRLRKIGENFIGDGIEKFH